MSALERIAGREMLDADPLKAAILRDAAIALARTPRELQPQDRGIATLAAIIGFDEKSLRRILTAPRITLDLADRYCCATDRLLSDLYPEVYDDGDSWLERCKTCRQNVDHDVLGGARLRLIIRCRDCGRVQYVERRKRPIPSNAFPSKPVATAQLAADYESGLTLYEVGQRHGMSIPGVRDRLIAAGVPLRRRGPRDENARLAQLAAARGRATRSIQARARCHVVLPLWEEGHTAAEIAAQLGFKKRAIYDIVHKARQKGVPVARRKGT